MLLGFIFIDNQVDGVSKHSQRNVFLLGFGVLWGQQRVRWKAMERDENDPKLDSLLLLLNWDSQ